MSFNPEEISDRINDNFLLLLKLNDINRGIIAKYKDDTFGKKRNIAYNFSGLYSQE